MYRILVLVVATACSGGTSSPTSPNPPSGSAPADAIAAIAPAPLDAAAVAPAPDAGATLGPAPATPAAKPLTLDEARTEAARLANAAFAARTDLRHPDGTRVPGNLEPKWFRGGFANGRWKLAVDPPSGPRARVSFDRFGGDPEVVVGYSDE